MVNSAKLKGLIAEKGLSQAQVAKTLGMSPKTFYQKMFKGIWKSNELAALKIALKMSDQQAIDIFFAL
jgi:DNA-binding XRE family transcriptional regulator|nr:MAG TPA: Regulatory protein [Caudoviricetes sp.]